MSKTTRQISTPGAQPAPAAAAASDAHDEALGLTGDESAGAAGAGSAGDDLDLSQFDTDDLPPAPVGKVPAGTAITPELIAAVLNSPEAKAAIASTVAAAVNASKAGQSAKTAAQLAAGQPEKLPTVEAAATMCEDAVARGQRPRAILTEAGWYVHPEMARVATPDVARLGG